MDQTENIKLTKMLEQTIELNEINTDCLDSPYCDKKRKLPGETIKR